MAGPIPSSTLREDRSGLRNFVFEQGYKSTQPENVAAPKEPWVLAAAAMPAKPVPAQLTDMAGNTAGIHLI